MGGGRDVNPLNLLSAWPDYRLRRFRDFRCALGVCRRLSSEPCTRDLFLLSITPRTIYWLDLLNKFAIT